MCSFLYYIFLCYYFKSDHLSCDNFVIISPCVFLPKTWQTQSSGPDIEALDRRQEKNVEWTLCKKDINVERTECR
jgi:hypothetical protein